MENLYQIPSESRGAAEQRNFWAKVVAEQIASGMDMEKFCQQHQLPFSKFHYWKYRKIKLLSNNASKISKRKNRQYNKDASRFVALQVAADTPSNERHKNGAVSNPAKEVIIIFKNGHKITRRFTSEVQFSVVVETQEKLL